MLRSWVAKAKIGLDYALFREGPLTMAPSQLGAFAKSDPSLATPDLQFHVQPISLDRFGDPPHPFPAFTASVCNLRPTRPRPRAHQIVRIRATIPAIAPNYLSTDEDRRTAVAALRLARRIVTGTEAMKKHEPEEFMPGPAFQSDDELLAAAGNIGTTIFHPVGTCKMGRDSDPTAVVDARFRVRGIERLRVIDASIMPTITSGNTNSPTLMIAERAAGIVMAEKRDWRDP